jgi:hypothetical protein
MVPKQKRRQKEEEAQEAGKNEIAVLKIRQIPTLFCRITILSQHKMKSVFAIINIYFVFDNIDGNKDG